MSLHPDFPTSPYAPLLPDQRWFPADEALRGTSYAKLVPPLVAQIREEVFNWRNNGYVGASATSLTLLRWWFDNNHFLENADGSLFEFRYYFAQREAVETVIWLYEVKRARDKFDLLRFDASGAASAGVFPEDWTRYVLKMATGAGKTKVLSLLLAWSFFHRLYEPDSSLARNFLVIAPNIIVLERLRPDFDGLCIFFNDPILSDNRADGRNWRDDFQMTLHIQDDVRVIRDTRNIFLTNVHRIFLGDVADPSLEDEDLRDYFLAPFGPKPVGRTNDSCTHLGEIIRDVKELAVFNDEAQPAKEFQTAIAKFERKSQLPIRLPSELPAFMKTHDVAVINATASDHGCRIEIGKKVFEGDAAFMANFSGSSYHVARLPNVDSLMALRPCFAE